MGSVSERESEDSSEEKDNNEQYSETQEMAIDVAFKLHKTVGVSESGNWKRVLDTIIARR